MYKTEFFNEEHQYELEQKINKFIQNKRVINISYSTTKVGYSTHHYCCVLYVE